MNSEIKDKAAKIISVISENRDREDNANLLREYKWLFGEFGAFYNCNKKEDFENLIKNNYFLRENKDKFGLLLESNSNDLLDLYEKKLGRIIKIYNSDELKKEDDRENFKRDFFKIINKYKCKEIFTKNIEELCKIIANNDIKKKLFVDLIETIIIGNSKKSDKYDEYEMLDVDRSKINELENKIKSENFIKDDVIKIVGENNITRYLYTILGIFKDSASILAQYNLPIIMGISNTGEDNDYINNSLFYRIFAYLCEFEYRYKALKNQFDLAIVSIMNDLGKRNKVLADSNKVLEKEIEKSNEELKKEIEKKKSQKQIIGEVEEVYKQNLNKFNGINYLAVIFFITWAWFLFSFNSLLNEVELAIKGAMFVLFGYIITARSRFFKFSIMTVDINYLALGLSILGSLLTFTNWFNGLFIKLGGDNSEKVLLVGNGLDFYKIIMIKIPFVIIGLIAYRNIQRNRFFKEEYQHKNTVMKIFNQFREDSDNEVRDKSKLIMLEMFKENPNDKLIKKDKDMTEKIIKVIENTVKTALQKEKNSNK